jgi:hypothetical protein
MKVVWESGPLEESDKHHIEAAEGWLHLGDWEEGRREILSVSPAARAHPEVVRVMLQFMMARQQWQAVAEGGLVLCLIAPQSPDGWFYRAAALGGMERITEARDLLLGVVDRFSGVFQLYYLLASFCCRLDDLKEGRRWWKQAVACYESTELKDRALEDPGLKKLFCVTGRS